jgi:hypothetical protein
MLRKIGSGGIQNTTYSLQRWAEIEFVRETGIFSAGNENLYIFAI